MGIAIITGASSGIGREIARQLCRDYKVEEFWFIARRAERMEALRDELGCEARIISADLSSEEGINAVRSALEAEKPTVDYLVNAAGFGNFGTFDELAEWEVASMIDLNVKALVLITHMVIPYMPRGGRIIELGSASAFTPLAGFNVYAASKSFVLHYTKALNHEIKSLGITATCFCPGWVDTEFIGKASTAENRTAPKKCSPLLKCESAVKGCLRAAKRGKAVYTTGLYTKFQHLLYKLLPSSWLAAIWTGMLNRKL